MFSPRVELYSRDNENFSCPWCEKAKALLISRGFKFTEYNTDVPSIKDALMARIPQAKTIPQIFINGRHVGGYVDLVEYLENTSGGYGDDFR